VRPVLRSWGGLELPSYETALAVGACLLVWLTVQAATRRGLPRRETALSLAAAYTAGLLGARLLYALEVSDTLGAAAAGLAAFGLRLSWARLADAAVVGLCVAAAVGRVGCLLAGCCHGRPTGFPWGIVYPRGSLASGLFGAGVAVHPTPLYEATALLVLAAGLSRVRGTARPGALWLRFLAAYCVLRLLTDLTRGDLERYGGLSLAQWMTGATLVVVLVGARVWSATRVPRAGIRPPSGVYS
jgi:phosphatidylglycerol:prolipoprotein diacylglycerol transferase